MHEAVTLSQWELSLRVKISIQSLQPWHGYHLRLYPGTSSSPLKITNHLHIQI